MLFRSCTNAHRDTHGEQKHSEDPGVRAHDDVEVLLAAAGRRVRDHRDLVEVASPPTSVELGIRGTTSRGHGSAELEAAVKVASTRSRCVGEVAAEAKESAAANRPTSSSRSKSQRRPLLRSPRTPVSPRFLFQNALRSTRARFRDISVSHLVRTRRCVSCCSRTPSRPKRVTIDPPSLRYHRSVMQALYDNISPPSTTHRGKPCT